MTFKKGFTFATTFGPTNKHNYSDLTFRSTNKPIKINSDLEPL